MLGKNPGHVNFYVAIQITVSRSRLVQYRKKSFLLFVVKQNHEREC